MSIRMMTRVWETGPSNQGELLVLLAMADFADDAGNCWPSMATIAAKARVQERSAIRIVRRLEASGYVKTVIGGGRYGCNQYQINPDPVPPLTESHPDLDATKTLTLSAENPDRSVTQTIIEPSIEPLSRYNARDGFDDFWSAYPRKTVKSAARKAYAKAVKKARHDEIMFGLSRHLPALQAKEQQFIPHPATWLNQERWSDEPEQPDNNIQRRTMAGGEVSAGRGRGGGIAAAVARRQLSGGT